MRAVLLTGPVASGKTAVAQEMVSICEEHGLAAAAIDLDWLGWSTGGSLLVGELIARNLAAVAANYAAAGIEQVVLARAYVGESNLDAIKESLPRWKLAVVSLEGDRLAPRYGRNFAFPVRRRPRASRASRLQTH